jgi:fucose permease
LFFFYVGIEATVGGWLVAYAESVAKGVIPLLIGSGFWAALLLGRGLSPWVLRRVSEPRLFLAALTTSLAGALCLRFAVSEWWIAAAALVMGFGLAPVFPLTVSFLAGQTEAAGGRQAGWVFAFAGLGGATLPWLTGRLPGADATLARGFIVPVVALVLMFGLFGLQRRIADGLASTSAPTDAC